MVQTLVVISASGTISSISRVAGTGECPSTSVSTRGSAAGTIIETIRAVVLGGAVDAIARVARITSAIEGPRSVGAGGIGVAVVPSSLTNALVQI